MLFFRRSTALSLPHVSVVKWMVLPLIVGVLIGVTGFGLLYHHHNKYNPARECYKMGDFNDCAETVRRDMLSQEVSRSGEQTFQNVLLSCKTGNQPEACELIYDYLQKKPEKADQWIEKFI